MRLQQLKQGLLLLEAGLAEGPKSDPHVVKLLKMELQVNRQQIHESKKRCSLLESQNLELMERIKLLEANELSLNDQHVCSFF